MMLYLQFTLHEKPIDGHVSLYINDELQPTDSYGIGQRRNKTILEWRYPRSGVIFTDIIKARYLLKDGYYEQFLLTDTRQPKRRIT